MAEELDKEKRTKMIVAGIFVIFLAYLVIIALYPYASAFFVAIFSYLALKPLYEFLRKHKLGKTTSALLSMLIGIIVIGIPLILFIQILITETTTLLTPDSMQNCANSINQIIDNMQERFPGIDLRGNLSKELTELIYQIINTFKNLMLSSIQNIGLVALQTLVAIFAIYYLLVNEEKTWELARKIVPFNKKNTDRLVDEFNRVTYSVLMSLGVMGVIQALPLMLVFMYYGIPGAAFLGVFALLLTFIPFVGIPFVWIPVAISEWFGHNESAAIGITITGIILAIVENYRPIMQRYFGQIHPLVALLGVIIGIANFGILGVLVGPLILSYALLIIQMFREEYL